MDDTGWKRENGRWIKRNQSVISVEDVAQQDPDLTGVRINKTPLTAQSPMSLSSQDFEQQFGKIFEATEFSHEGENVSTCIVMYLVTDGMLRCSEASDAYMVRVWGNV